MWPFPKFWPMRRFVAIGTAVAYRRSRRAQSRLRRLGSVLHLQDLEPRLALANASWASALSIAVVSPATYKAGESLVFDVAFSRQVFVTNTPTVAFGAASATLVEAAVGVTGVNEATLQLTPADVDGTVRNDTIWLAANGWSTSNAGVTYTKSGTYGTATLTIATSLLSYLLNDTITTTQALTADQQAIDSFTVQVTDNSGATAQAVAKFSIIGSNDVPMLSGSLSQLVDGDLNTDYTLAAADLLAGFSDVEGDTLSVANVRCTFSNDTVVHAVVANQDGSFTITPATSFTGLVTLNYDVVDGKGGITAATNSFSFTTNTHPSLTLGVPTPAALVEAGGINNATAGLTTAVVMMQKSDPETNATYDEKWLVANGWQAVTGGYIKQGIYGSAQLTVASDALTYSLDNTRAVTEALRAGQSTTEAFTVRVTDGSKIARAEAVFQINGSNDGPRLASAMATFAPGVEDISYVLRASDLLEGLSDPEGSVLTIRNPSTSSGTILDRGNGTYILTPGANYHGDVRLAYDVVDDHEIALSVQATLIFIAAIDAPIIKNFVITGSDIAYLNEQVNVPIVRAVRYQPNGTPVYGYTDPNRSIGIVELGVLGSFDLMNTSWAQFLPPVVSAGGTTAAGISEPVGLRNMQGLFNNLSPDAAAWGSAFSAFARNSNADYSHYATGSVDLSKAYANPFTTVYDSTPRMISQIVDSYQALERVDAAAPGTITDHVVYQITDLTTGFPQVGGFDASGNPLAGGLYFSDDYIRNLNTLSGDPTLTGWSVLFGQFFDHGLDFIGKGGGNTTAGVGSKVFIALDPSDPLYDLANGVTRLSISRATVSNPEAAGADGMFRTADDILSPGLDNTYGTSDDVIGLTNPEYINHTSPYIDQSQTYGSNDDVTNLLREWVRDPVSGQYVPGMYLLDGTTLATAWERPNPDGTVSVTHNTLPTLNELRAYLLATGRDDLSWSDINNMRARDEHGKVLDLDPAAGTQAKLTDHILIADMLPRLDAPHLFQDPLDGVPGHVDLLAGFSGISRPASGSKPADRYVSDYVDVQSGRPTALGTAPSNAALVGEILLRSISDHYIAGDGRANENFGLTAMHHVWHENHNWQIDNFIESLRQKQTADPTKTIAHGWQVAITGTNGQPLTDALGNYVDAQGRISWDQEKVFQAGLFVNQMEYQHVAIDQYARGHSPNIPLFVMYDTSVNADVTLDYSQMAFRFGHSELQEVIDALDPNGSLTAAVTHYALEQAFLDPAGYAQIGPTAIAQGMSRQSASEIDEFVTPALQQKLLGQPQDLAAINIARGRDLGMPTLNNLRRELSAGMATQLAVLQTKLLDTTTNNGGVVDSKLRETVDKTIALQAGLLPYTSWNDYGNNIQNLASLNNFIAAYAFGGDIVTANAVVNLNNGIDFVNLATDEQAAVQLLGWTTNNATVRAMTFMGVSDAADKSFETIDAWDGGLAEKHVFLGQLGSTFDTIFCDQMTRLINGDRDYYFWRLQLGLVTFTELSSAVTTEQFKDVIERTTGAKHLVGEVMYMADSYVELSENPDSIASGSNRQHKYGDLVQALQVGVYSGNGPSEGFNGSVISQAGVNYIVDVRPNLGENPDGTPSKGFDSHEVLGGTAYRDYIDMGDGDDTVYGDAGNDTLLGNAGADHIYGDTGNDLIYGGMLPDFLDGGVGDDEIHGGDDADVIIGADGNDRLFGENFPDEMHGNLGDDYIDGGIDADIIFGGDDQDIVVGGEGLDTTYGEWGDDRMFAGPGPDQLFGGYGDDILNGGSGGQNQNLNVDECLGEFGYNLVSFSDVNIALNRIADLNYQNVNMGASTPFGQLWVTIQGIEGGSFADQIIGDGGNNWLIGGGGNDVIAGGAGDDVIIADSMRLDTLIGSYNANGVLQHNGVLDTVAAGGGKHFQDLVRSVPDFTLGNNVTIGATGISYRQSTAGTTDMVAYAGGRQNFDITLIYNPANPAEQIGIRVVDKTGVETSSVGDVIFGVEKLLFGYDFTAVNAASTGLKAHSPLPAATFESLGKGAYPVALLAGETVSPYTAALVGFAAESSANPLASSIGVTSPANVLSISIPAAAGVVQALGTQWEVYNATAKNWDNIAGASGATFTPSAADGLPQGATIRAMSEFIDASGSLKLIYSNVAAPLGRQVVGTVGNNVLVGTAFQDVIYGGADNDSLDGLAGSDYLAGGPGNDTYVVDAVTDTVVEQVSEGIDTVSSSVTYTLGANVENLTLTGNGNINATGNDLGNTITGNAGNNQLTGGSLDDVLIGGLGADTLTGGAGSNTYRYTDLTQSLTTAMDVITSFIIGVGNQGARDTFDAPIAVTSGNIRKVAVGVAYSLTNLQAQFTTSNFVTNGAATLVTFENSTTEAYLVINNSVAGFDSTTDLVVKILYTGTLSNFTIV